MVLGLGFFNVTYLSNDFSPPKEHEAHHNMRSREQLKLSVLGWSDNVFDLYLWSLIVEIFD